MAAKMAAANIKTGIPPLLIHLGTYFLGRIVGIVTTESIRYVQFAYNVCKSNMAAKMAAENMEHYNIHNQMYIMMAYNGKYLLHSLSALYARDITH